MRPFNFISTLLALFLTSFLCGEEEKDNKPPQIGNFSLPSSQQPNRLFSFGNTLIDKNQVQLFFFADDFIGKDRRIVTLLPTIEFGVSESCAVTIFYPYVPVNRERHESSKGLGDISMQVEFSIYNKSTSCFVDQATFLAAFIAPTGSIIRRPATGFGSPALFVGATYNRMMIDWFMFAGQGAFLTTSKHRSRAGDQFLYQVGIGRNIPSPGGWIWAWMVELDGQYSQKNRIRGEIDHNSGGNAIFFYPIPLGIFETFSHATGCELSGKSKFIWRSAQI